MSRILGELSNRNVDSQVRENIKYNTIHAFRVYSTDEELTCVSVKDLITTIFLGFL